MAKESTSSKNSTYKADIQASGAIEIKNAQHPLANFFQSSFGPGFIALFWGGMGLWAAGMMTFSKMLS